MVVDTVTKVVKCAGCFLSSLKVARINFNSTYLQNNRREQNGSRSNHMYDMYGVCCGKTEHLVNKSNQANYCWS